MPELPEVETIRRGLQAGLVGRRIVDVECAAPRLRKPSPLPWTLLQDRTVVSVGRHAKVLAWHLDDGMTASIHLGMTGKFLFSPPGAPARPHTHLRLVLEDGELHFVDPRRFGWFTLHPPGAPATDTAHYGLDALDPAWTPARLGALLGASRAPVKAFLLDQTRMAGLGNIYVCEALWRAGISPRRLACHVPRAKHAVLLAQIRHVLRDALAQGGTSFNDYVDAIGRPGGFAGLAVFQRAGDHCPRCGHVVKRIVQSGRSTFYCGGCQR